MELSVLSLVAILCAPLIGYLLKSHLSDSNTVALLEEIKARRACYVYCYETKEKFTMQTSSYVQVSGKVKFHNIKPGRL